MNQIPKDIIAILFLLLLFGCKSNYGLTGTYKTEYKKDVVQNEYIVNFTNHEYTEFYKNATCGAIYSKGSFKVLKLTDKKFLLVCNNFILEKENPEEKIDTTENSPESYFRGRSRSKTVFELTLSKTDSLYFRKTTTNQLDKTLSKGNLTFIK